MSDYIVLFVGLAVFFAFGCFFSLAFVSNNRAAGFHQEVIQSLRGIHSNHIHLALTQTDTSRVLLKVADSFNDFDAAFRRDEKVAKRASVRHISRNTSRQLRRSEGRCAQLFADRAIAVAEKTRAERDFVAAQDHIRQLLRQRNTHEDVARLDTLVAALGARIAKLEHQEQSRLVSPPTPPPATPTPSNNILATSNLKGLSPITLVNAIKPVQPIPVSDPVPIAKINHLELELAEVNKSKEELEDAVKASDALVTGLQDQMDVMQERHYEEMASINKKYGIVKDECFQLQNDRSTIQREAEERREKLLQAQFEEEKHKLEQQHKRSCEMLQARLDAAEQNQAKSLSEQRKLETDQSQLMQQFEREKGSMIACYKKENDELQGRLDASEKKVVEVLSEKRKLEIDLKETEVALQTTRDDPLSLLPDDQKQQITHYPSLIFMLCGDGTASNPGLQVRLNAVTMELDDARIDEAALQVEISELTETNIALKLELEELKKLNVITLAQPNQTSSRIHIAESPRSMDENAVASTKLALSNNAAIVYCVGYILGNGEKFINKTCRAGEQLVALPHWQRDDAVWVPKWGVHMKTCSHNQESEAKTSPTKRVDDKTIQVAKDNDSPKNQGLQEKAVVLNTVTPKLGHVWVPSPTYASEPTPESVHGLKQCNKCDSWYEFDTKFEKDTFRMHVNMCEEVVCKNEGCGDVMSKDHFFKEHQQVCKQRAVGERKKLSFTEAAKLVPKKQDTLDILTVDGTARELAERAPAEATSEGVTNDNHHGTKEALRPEEGRKRGGLQGHSVWATS